MQPKPEQIGYAILRFTLGINMLMHGLVRLCGDYGGFVDALDTGFEGTFLPSFFVRGFAYLVPPLEAVIGLLLIPGLLTIPALTACGLLLAAFVFGKCLQQDWSTVGLQMVYAVTVFLLFAFCRENRLSLDARRARGRDTDNASEKQ